MSHKKYQEKIRVLIVETALDDRENLQQALSDCPDIEVLATAPNGNIGLIKNNNLNPDLILLDIKINDILSRQFIKECFAKKDHPGIILTTPSDPIQKQVEEVILSLEQGAFDFIKKPNKIPKDVYVFMIRRKLLPKIRSFSIKHYSQIAKKAAAKHDSAILVNNKQLDTKTVIKPLSEYKSKIKLKAIVIGVSTGGTEALARIIPRLSASYPLPIVIVLHMPETFTASMAVNLDKKSKLNVKEAAEGDILKNGYVFMARGGKHLVIKKGNNSNYYLEYKDSPAENGCKPSIDVLFRSAAEVFKSEVLAIIMTGMGNDGVKGIGLLKKNGAITIAQDESTSVIWGMPGAAIKAGHIDEILPLGRIANRLLDVVR